MAILAVGSIAFDTIETLTGRADEALGGSAIYFSCAASLFGDVRLVGVVGGDFPQERLDLFKARPVDISGLEIREGKTFRWHGRYHEDMNSRDTIDVQLNVFGEFQPKIPPAFRETEYVFLANCHPALQMSVLDQVKKPKFVMADTMNLWIDTTPDDLRRLLGRIDGLLINDDEARMLTGAPNLVVAGKRILEMGPRLVVIKKGEHGSLLFANGKCAPLPAYPVERVIDPTGAGDSFAGGLMGYIAENDDWSMETLKRGAAYGTVLASFTCEKFGVDSVSVLDRPALENRLAAYREMITVW